MTETVSEPTSLGDSFDPDPDPSPGPTPLICPSDSASPYDDGRSSTDRTGGGGSDPSLPSRKTTDPLLP